MKCLTSENISAYLDNELEEKKRSSVESHVRDCTRCAMALEEMRALRTSFAGAEGYRAPLGFLSRVLARTAALDRKRSRWFVPLLIKFAEVAVILIVIAVGIITGRAVTNGRSSQQAANINSSFSLDLFDATPPGSLGGAYLAMTEAGNEK